MEYFKQNLSREVFEQKYCLNGEKSVEEVFAGVAEDIANAEETDALKDHWKDVFFDQMISERFFPGGRIMANARTDTKMRFYNNCYTIDIEDSIDGIYSALKEDAQISSTGGGVGANVSKLRPKGCPVSKGGESSGVISFLKVFNESAKVIHTGGARRAAHIAILNVDHPDIEEFITCKRGAENEALTQFNISVGVTNKFMNAVERDEDWDLQFDGVVYKTVKARYLFDLITQNSYIHNEPGLFFLDTVERFNNGYWAFKLDRVNPCGEITMPSYSVCDLGSINLPAFVVSPFTEDAYFNWEAFRDTIAMGVRFLDNVLTQTEYPLEKIEEMSMGWRRIGLGFTGLGDLFAMMGYVYGDHGSQLLSDSIGSELMMGSYKASLELAKEKGAFPQCDNLKLAQAYFIQKHMPDWMINDIKIYGLRNIALNTTAPTGTMSLTVGNNCSSGIEPIFALKYNRNVRTGRGEETRQETVYDKAWLEYIDYLGMEPDVVPDFFTTTMKVSVEAGIEIQSIFQEYIDHSISKTINIPPGTTFEQYKDIYWLAFKKGLKGTTSFNPEGSMKGVLEYDDKEEAIERLSPKRPKNVPCDIYTSKVKGQEFTILVGLVDGKPYEVFATNSKEGLKNGTTGIISKRKKNCYDLVIGKEVIIENLSKAFDAEYGTLSRWFSIALRHQIPLQFIVDQMLKGFGFVSFEKAVANKLKKYISDDEEMLSSAVCPDCESKLAFQDGCKFCPNCGYGACG